MLGGIVMEIISRIVLHFLTADYAPLWNLYVINVNRRLAHGAKIELTTRQKMRHRLTCSYEWYVDIHRSYG